MTRTLLSTSVAIAALLFTSHAQAGDMPMASSWQGGYGGVQAGYGMGADNNVKTTGQAAVNVTNVNSGARPGSVGVEPDGFLGGVQAGYNWQRQNMVFGLETDIAYTDLDETTSRTGTTGLNNEFTQQLDYFGTVRGRIGYAYDRLLVFGTGGLAYGGIDNEATFFGAAGQEQFKGDDSGLEIGYTAGGGFEYAFTDMISLKGEYLYYDLGDDTVDVAVIPGSGGGGTGYNSKFDNSGHIFRTGLNYKF